MKLTLKQFLFEGGKATEQHGTVRATKEDMLVAIKSISEVTGKSEDLIQASILGSGRLTLLGKQADSGDMDVALLDVNKEEIVKKLEDKTGIKARAIGGSTFSFAVPTKNNRKIQVDLMFVPSLDWAVFSHYAAEDSKHKSGVRNELLHAALKHTMTPGEDVRVKDENGHDIVRATWSYDLINGLKRIFKISKKRKDGKGRVKGTEHVTPEEVEKTLKELNRNDKFKKEQEVILEPKVFAELLFGRGTTEADLGSTENLINLINKRQDKDKILKDAVAGIKARNFKVPDELRSYE